MEKTSENKWSARIRSMRKAIRTQPIYGVCNDSANQFDRSQLRQTFQNTQNSHKKAAAGESFEKIDPIFHESISLCWPVCPIVR